MISALFEKSGMLAALYTDSTAYSFAGRVACFLSRIRIRTPRMSALISRAPEGIPVEKVYSFDRFPLMLKFSNLGKAYKGCGLQGAHVLYSMCGEEFEFLFWAKSQGIKLIIDVFIHPKTLRNVADEEAVYMKNSEIKRSWIDGSEAHFKRVIDLADIIICPSSWVAEGVRELHEKYNEKIRIVPYGSSLKSRHEASAPEMGRILFVGRDALRKGVHYLADAAEIVRSRGLDIDVRVAGVSAGQIKWISKREQLNCLGELNSGQLCREFELADVFVLPSLSEGQAGVVLEAMACGCPVIATRESGVDFRDGSGITVPARNAELLADAIIRVIGNREERNMFAAGALKHASDFSMEAWGQRLVNVVREAVLV